MESRHDRLKSLIGENNLEKLKRAKVIVFGLGGVGGATIEALARSGIGEIAVCDNDTFEPTNLNRQVLATEKTIGKSKVEVALNRIAEIDKNIKTTGYDIFYLPETAHQIPLDNYDYIIDCVDTVTAKLHLVKQSKELNIPIISAMGTGNKLDPSQFRVADLSETETCPLSRVMRAKLKKMEIDPKSVKVVFSPEQPLLKSRVPASNSTCPLVCGLIMANEVIADLMKGE
ncbi:MAG: tRNA threonylcarbamoyladenosine dehydratase [Clostridia bacterium]|nr:tRNA threonylcarbamoyladenosine dehydratase [Clostridia bacterium]